MNNDRKRHVQLLIVRVPIQRVPQQRSRLVVPGELVEHRAEIRDRFDVIWRDG
jgi:hypothetical protein